MNKLLSAFSLVSLATCTAGLAKADELPFNLSGHVRVNYGHQDWQQPEFRDGFEFESFNVLLHNKSLKVLINLGVLKSVLLLL